MNWAKLQQDVNRWTQNAFAYLNFFGDYFLATSAGDATITLDNENGTQTTKTVPNWIKSLAGKADEHGDTLKDFNAKTLTATSIKGRRVLGPESIDIMHRAGYISNDGNNWQRIAWIDNLENNQFVRIDFATSNHFGNNQPPIVGSFVVRTGNDNTSDDYVTPSIEQSSEAIVDFHVYKGSSGYGLYVKLHEYSSFYITAISKSSNSLDVTLYENYPAQPTVSGSGHYPDKVITLTRPRAGQVQEISWLASYFGGSNSHYWAYIAEVDFIEQNRRVVLDFVMSRGYTNGAEPAVGSIALQSGNDSSSESFITPSVIQTKDGIENILLYSIGGNHSRKRVFIQAKRGYSSIEVTRVATDNQTVKLTVSAPQESVDEDPRYPDNIHTIA